MGDEANNSAGNGADSLSVTDIPGSPPTARPRAPILVIPRRSRTTWGQIGVFALGVVAFFYFARPVVLPVMVAGIAGMALAPLMRWLSKARVPAALGAAIVLSLLTSLVVAGFVGLGKPAVAWMNEAPENLAKLKQKLEKVFRPAARFSRAAAAVNSLGSTEEDRKKVTPVEIKTSRVPSTLINWTGTVLAGVGETMVLLFLFLASGDMFTQKLVRVMPTLRDKKRAVEISREIQQNISNYLFSVSLINAGLGLAVSAGLAWIGVPNPALWGALAALLNYIPYFGPLAGIVLLGFAGLLSFDDLWRCLTPPAWYLGLHLIEANLLTPVFLGRRFTLNPVVIFISLIFWTWLWGLWGALLSVPILVSFKVVCDRLPPLSSISEVLAGANGDK